MGWLAGLLGRMRPNEDKADLALQALHTLRKLVGDAKTIDEARQRIIAGATKGDLDDVVGIMLQSDAEVADFIKHG